MSETLHAFLRDEAGLTIVEYAVAAGIITFAVALSFTFLADAVEVAISTLNSYITRGRCCD